MNSRDAEKDLLHIPVPLAMDVGGIRGSERRSVSRCLPQNKRLERHECPLQTDIFQPHESTVIASIWDSSPDAQARSLSKDEGQLPFEAT